MWIRIRIRIRLRNTASNIGSSSAVYIYLVFFLDPVSDIQVCGLKDTGFFLKGRHHRISKTINFLRRL
jgi:hypothetical protein